MMNDKPTIEYKPQSQEELRSRYSDALQTIYDVESISMGLAKPPAAFPANIFDCEDGVRLIISQEDMPNVGPVIHVSASLVNGSPAFKQLRIKARVDLQGALKEFIAEIEQRFADISQNIEPLEFLGYSVEKMIPHWIQKCNRE